MLKESRAYFSEHPNKEDRPEEFDEVVEEVVDRMKNVCELWKAGRKRHHVAKRARYLALMETIQVAL